VKDEEVVWVAEVVSPESNSKPKTVQTEENSKPRNTEIVKTESTASFVLHTVKNGETLFSISKLYNISIDELKNINQLTGNNIRPGQELKLEKAAVAIKESKPKPEEKPTTLSREVIHTVTSGESLFSISKRYNISVDELKRINDLSSNNILPGQKLKLQHFEDKNVIVSGVETKTNSNSQTIHKVKSGDSFYSIAKTYGCTVEKLKEWNHKTGNTLQIGEKLIVYPKNI
jgi:membrane-bound lytic murein transglycosylase D